MLNAANENEWSANCRKSTKIAADHVDYDMNKKEIAMNWDVWLNGITEWER